MQWSEDALIIGTKRYGESNLIIEVMTRGHGRHLGLVRGGRSRSLRASMQVGNAVHVTWRARLEDHLGVFAIEPLQRRAAWLMQTASGLHGVQAVANLLRLLPERAPHPGLARGAEILIENLNAPVTNAVLFVRFELALLEELGFGLDLSACAANGTKHHLAYVSPKSGRAVSREAGAPYHDRLLPLPAFLLQSAITMDASEITENDLKAAFQLTDFFLSRNIFEPRGLSQSLSRDAMMRAMLKSCC